MAGPSFQNGQTLGWFFEPLYLKTFTPLNLFILQLFWLSSLTLYELVGELCLAISELQHMSTQVSKQDVFPSVSMVIVY